jgi:hypothetical protein
MPRQKVGKKLLREKANRTKRQTTGKKLLTVKKWGEIDIPPLTMKMEGLGVHVGNNLKSSILYSSDPQPLT